MNQEIIEYIRANRDMYTREAINQELLDAGHSPEDIAAGWQALEEEDTLTQVQATTPPPRRRVGGLVALWILLLIIGFVIVALTNLGLGLSNGSQQWFNAKYNIINAVNIGSLIVGLGLLIATVQLLGKGWPMGRIVALVFVSALVWYTIVLGTCLYAPRVIG
jgi:hypothetical protein